MNFLDYLKTKFGNDSESKVKKVKPTLKGFGYVYDLGNFGEKTYDGIMFERYNQYDALYYFGEPTEEQLAEAIKDYDSKRFVESKRDFENRSELEYQEFKRTNKLTKQLYDFIQSGNSIHIEELKIDKNSEEAILDYMSNYDNYMDVRTDMFLKEEQKKSEILIGLRNDKGITKELVDSVINTMTKLQEQGRDVDVVCCTKIKRDINDQTPYIYTPEEFEALKPLDEWCLQNKNKHLFFSESSFGVSNSRGWNYSQVKEANYELDKICNNIKDKNLSPFEAVLFVHNYATGFVYNNSSNSVDNAENTYQARTLPGLFIKNKIVCVNYSHLVKAVFDKLQMEGVNVSINTCTIAKKSNKNKFEHHANNIVEINDPKYGISGTYRLDACWDSKKDGKRRGFGHCLFPMNDVNSLKNNNYLKHQVHTMVNLDTFGFDSEKQKETFTNSEPIKLKTYFEGIKAIYKKAYNHGETQAENAAIKLLEESANTIKPDYNKKSANCFARCTTNDIKNLRTAERTI